MGITTSVKFTPRSVRLKSNPVFIVGEKPGKQRKGSQDSLVWRGNRSGDFIDELVKDSRNVYLTNACNYQDPTSKQRLEGALDLEKDILRLRPEKIICMGSVARSVVAGIVAGKLIPITLVFIDHPSYVLRFNKNVEYYKSRVLRELEEV